VRCYWSLLTPLFPDPAVSGSKLELVFVHPDPVLSTHLAKQKINFLGRGVIEFIHPAERERESPLSRAGLMSRGEERSGQCYSVG